MTQENQSLEEKLKRAQELTAQRTQEKMRADEESRLSLIRNQIVQLEEKKQNLETLLEKLVTGYTEAGQAVGEFKHKKEKVSELYDLYNQLLQNEFGKEVAQEEFGINPDQISSKQDFIKALKQSQEVQGYHKTGKEMAQKVKSLKSIKKGLKQEISDLSFRGGPTKNERQDGKVKSKREYAIEAIKDRITELGIEFDKLKERTPEGKEAMEIRAKQTVEDKVFRRHRGMRYVSTDFFQEINRGKIGQWRFVVEDDINDTKEYGDKAIKQAIKEYYYKEIDKGAERKIKDKGLDSVQKDLEYIRSFQQSFYEAKRRVDTLVWRKKQIEENILRFLYEDNWQRYGRPKILEEIMDNMALSRDFREDPINGLHSEVIEIEKQAKEAERFLGGDSASILYEFFRPERIIAYASCIEKAMDQIWETIEKNPESLKEKDFLYSYQDIGKDITDEEKNKRYALGEKTIGWIKNNGFNFSYHNKPEQALAKQEKEIQQEAQQKKELVSIKVDMEWANEKKESFRREHSMDSILNEYRELQEQRKQANEISRSLSSFKSMFSGKLGETVIIKKDDPRAKYFELESSRKDFEKIDEELNGNEDKGLVGKIEELKSLKERLTNKSREKEGLFHWKAKRIEKEYKELETREKTLEQEIRDLRSRREKLFTFYLELKKAVDSVIIALDLIEHIRDKKVTLKDILDLIPSRVEEIRQRKLSPEKQELYDEYDRLAKEFEKEKNRYEQLIKYH